jgi:hypothetical protein
MTNKLEIAKDLIQFFETPEFNDLKPVLAKYGIHKLDPIEIQTLIHKLAFELCKITIKEGE